VMPALVPPYASLPVISGRLALGTWQSLALWAPGSHWPWWTSTSTTPCVRSGCRSCRADPLGRPARLATSAYGG
jgi:hypothetical protein